MKILRLIEFVLAPLLLILGIPSHRSYRKSLDKFKQDSEFYGVRKTAVGSVKLSLGHYTKQSLSERDYDRALKVINNL